MLSDNLFEYMFILNKGGNIMANSSTILEKDKFCTRLAELRIKRGFNQIQMSKLLECTYSSYNQWENGTRLPRMQKIAFIAEKLGVPTSFLIGDTDSGKELNILNSLPLVESINFIGEDYSGNVMLKGGRFNPNTPISTDLFAFKVRDHSMSRSNGLTINSGMIVIVSRKYQPVEIKHAVACISLNKQEAIIREINFDDDHVIVTPWNDNYKEMVVIQTDLIVWGKVIKSIQEF